MDPYDQVPYDSFPCTVSHPDGLATAGLLFGLTPAPVTRCRVLELGCGTGGNLIPMAASLPQSQFVGIDLSRVQVDAGRRMVEALGLTNVQLEVGDLTALRSDLGRFDYLIAHGVFSWVSRPVQEGLFRAIAASLADQGIAFVSYSVLPGAYARLAVRDLLAWGVRAEADPQRRVARARRLAELVASQLPARGPQAAAIRRRLGELGGMSDAYLLHDYLSEVHEAVTLDDFVRRAGAHQLQYLADAQMHTMRLGEPRSREVEEALGPEADRVTVEQLNDHLHGRGFRSTLLCRAERTLDRSIRWERVRGLLASTWSKPRGQEKGHWMFRDPGGELFGTESELVGAALAVLAEAHPCPIPFPALCDQARGAVDGEPATSADIELLGESLLAAHLAGQVTLGTWDRGVRSDGGEPLRAFALARAQAAQESTWATNLWHRQVDIGPAIRAVLKLMDGSRSRAELLGALALAQPEVTEEALSEQLSWLAENAFLTT